MAKHLERRAWIVSAALVACLVPAWSAGAQPRAEEKANIAITGDIKSVDIAARTITIESTNDDGVVYSVGDGTTIMYEARQIALGDLKVGWNVAASGHELRGNRTLTYIKVVKSPEP